jgi:hypothetical protein
MSTPPYHLELVVVEDVVLPPDVEELPDAFAAAGV